MVQHRQLPNIIIILRIPNHFWIVPFVEELAPGHHDVFQIIKLHIENVQTHFHLVQFKWCHLLLIAGKKIRFQIVNGAEITFRCT